MDVPICLLKTEGEWKEILAKMGKKNFHSFIVGEVRRLGNSFAECPDCVTKASGKKKYKRPKIPLEYYEKIERIALEMQIPVSTVVDIFIILPLLQGKPSEILRQP
jgi:hypothetical protein